MAALSEAELAALRDALDDEYRAHATYDQVIADFGPVRPFVNIRDAEARHAAALTRLFVRFGVPVPGNRWPGRVPRFSSVREACRAAVAEEIENAGLYDRLLAEARHPDLIAVFRRLRAASQLRHLPAFRRCLERANPVRGRNVPEETATGIYRAGGGQRRHRHRHASRCRKEGNRDGT